jgi:hypothetical protein
MNSRSSNSESQSTASQCRTDTLSRFSQLFSITPPKRMSLELAMQNVEWAAQATNNGLNHRKLRTDLLRKLERAVSESPSKRSSAMQPGTRLVREWRGKTYEVMVENDGFLFRGQCFGSLSKIASLITGTRWSGPRFFGLNQHG